MAPLQISDTVAIYNLMLSIATLSPLSVYQIQFYWNETLSKTNPDVTLPDSESVSSINP